MDDDDSFSDSEFPVDGDEQRDVDLAIAVDNWWLFMEYNQKLWPKNKKELLKSLEAFTHVERQFPADQIFLFLMAVKILTVDQTEQKLEFNKENLLKYNLSTIGRDISVIEARLEAIKANPEAAQELLTKGALSKDTEERILEGDKKTADAAELSDYELELRRVSLTRVIVWLRYHQDELDAVLDQDLTRVLAIVGQVPVTLVAEDILNELVHRRLVELSEPLKIRVEPVQLQLNDSAARSIFKSVLYSFLTFLMFYGMIREFGSVFNLFRRG